MKLSQLLTQIGKPQAISADPEILGVALDSRLVQKGFIFVATQGIPLAGRAPLNGHDFIPKALENGAVAVVGSEDLHLNVPYLRTDNPREFCALLASEVLGRPQDRLHIVGITGSKGKSTTVALLFHLLEFAGIAVAQMSTVAVRYLGREEHLPGHFTTPESPQVYELLSRFADAGCTHVVMEVSSHALDLERVTGIEFAVGAFINFYPDDHIDFHGSQAAYFAAKAKLLHKSRFAVLLDSIAAQYGQHPKLERILPLTGVQAQADGLHFLWDDQPYFVPMIGEFNAINAAAALAIGRHLGIAREQLRQGLASFTGVPGRMQLIQAKPFRVINDFAHTGKSLEQAAQTLRQTTAGRLIVLIGAAGQRDPNRRTGIGSVAAQVADYTIFTEEDSRTESTQAILGQLEAAFLASGGGLYQLIPDRREAIHFAIGLAQEGDTVLLCGKGHERTLERGTEFLPWDETAEALEALRQMAL
ncbi:MAG: Mur ligase family protein [Deinococcales bacterium]